MGKGKSSEASFTALGDNYYNGQTDDGNGGSVSSYFLRELLRKAYLCYKKLFDKDPDANNANVPTGDGHTHDGTDSFFIGNTVAAQIRQPFETAEDFDTTEIGIGVADGWDGVNRWMPPIMYCPHTGQFSKNIPTLDKIFFGKGVNRARVWVLWSNSYTIPGGTYKAPAMGAVNITFRVACVNTSDVVDQVCIAIGVAPFIQWSEITESDLLIVTPDTENDLNLTIHANAGFEGYSNISIYGYVITEAKE